VRGELVVAREPQAKRGRRRRRLHPHRRRLEAAGYTVGSLGADGADVPAAAVCAWVEALGVL
jgi:hypothetical protein